MATAVQVHAALLKDVGARVTVVALRPNLVLLLMGTGGATSGSAAVRGRWKERMGRSARDDGAAGAEMDSSCGKFFDGKVKLPACAVRGALSAGGGSMA